MEGLEPMECNITLAPELYNQVVERARVENVTPDEWLSEAAKARLAREKTGERFRALLAENSRDMDTLGVKPSDVDREIQDHRRGG